MISVFAVAAELGTLVAASRISRSDPGAAALDPDPAFPLLLHAAAVVSAVTDASATIMTFFMDNLLLEARRVGMTSS
jgi:hypothetical protein